MEDVVWLVAQLCGGEAEAEAAAALGRLRSGLEALEAITAQQQQQ